MELASERQIQDAVWEVDEPHYPISIGEMGMVRHIAIEAGRVTVRLALPCLGCPAYGSIRDLIAQRVGAIAGVASVSVETAWDEPWSSEQIWEQAKPRMRDIGVVA